MSADAEDDVLDVRDAIYDANSIGDLRDRLNRVRAFWRQRDRATRLLASRIFWTDTRDPEAVAAELRGTLMRLVGSDRNAEALLNALDA